MKPSDKTGQEDEKEEPRLKLKDDVSFMEEQPAASAMECTGLIPSLPTTEDEAESYSDLYSVPAPRRAQNPKVQVRAVRRRKDGKK